MENKLTECFNCSTILPEALNPFFCPNCATQLKCKKCGEPLLLKAKACINCGTLVVNTQVEDKNIIDYEQKGEYKKFHSSFSNEVGNTLAETFATILGGGLQHKKIQNPFNFNAKSNTSKQLINNTNSKVNEPEDAVVLEDFDLNETLIKYFKFEDGKLKLINSRLKHNGKMDQGKRLTLLTLYAYEKAQQEQIEKTTLIDILTSASLYDSNFRKWFGRADEVLREGNNIQLSVPGRETSEAILKELADDTIIKGSIKFKEGTRSAKRNKKSGEENSDNLRDKSIAAKRNKGPIYYLEILIKEKFFDTKRKTGEIIEHLKVNKAETYDSRSIATPLKRMIKSDKLKREKNAEGQYEYFV